MGTIVLDPPLNLSSEEDMSDKLQPFCKVLSGDPEFSNVFSVQVSLTDTVDNLKKAIRDQKQKLQVYDADQLTLWKVSILNEENIGNFAFTGKPLSATTRLSKVFPDAPAEDHIHIVVQLPPGKLIYPYYLILSLSAIRWAMQATSNWK